MRAAAGAEFFRGGQFASESVITSMAGFGAESVITRWPVLPARLVPSRRAAVSRCRLL